MGGHFPPRSLFAPSRRPRSRARSPLLLCSRSIKTANVAADTALRKKIFIGYKDTHLQSNIILHPTTLYSNRVGKRELRKMLDNKLLWRTAIRHVVRHEVVLASASESGEQASELMQKRRSNSRGDYNGGQGKKKGCTGWQRKGGAKTSGIHSRQAGSQLCIDDAKGRPIRQSD